MSIRLLMGTSRKEITPDVPLPLAGFSFRDGHSTGIAQPLYIRVYVLRTEDCSGRSETALLVSADIIWWCSDRIHDLLACIAERWRIAPSAVLLNATHTHSGPQTSRRFVSCLGEFDITYVTYLEQQLFASIEEAFQCMEEVRIDRGIGECHIAMNRRIQVDGCTIMGPNESEPVDQEVHVIRFLTSNERVKALIVHYACHPTTSDESRISSEFPGIAMERLEKEFCPGSVAMFLQGCCGDVRPGLVKDGEFFRGDNQDVIRIGGMLCEEVAKVLEQGKFEPLELCAVSSRASVICLPLTELPDRARLLASLQEDGLIGEWSRMLIDDDSRMAPSVPFAMNVIRIAEGLSFLAMNGEVVTAYGLYVKGMYAGQVLPVAYSNGMIGYIPTARQLEEGGYESMDSYMYFGLPATYSQEIERMIQDGIRNLLQWQDE
ncbi:neutral/alkaline non-lysosomal ceramidase N-terminal domain-containing protein [Paenibacillus sp. J5C_2022]|uniref:neutral/alkaline non-lysosomal ceramidase N-terminal domain-containing protein n=1 Tax=Paenibacillus sp. J5C2022 TaxID=2977129 RepID=UPI0021D1D87E|nr:neutral/alkaline non-lysosomal ceramidase N-terminal domain-containing protein [Paenibacillus sp. J5C2022]MCU6708821.1 neutral/alkaline non-lysosomal ceramidase N-terminal domain-containing protein [Paenibacillus sp. J5C2022]